MKNLESRLKGISPEVFNGKVFRIVTEDVDPLSTRGSVLFGGRYNRKNIKTIYTANGRDVAKAEFIKNLEKLWKFIKGKVVKVEIQVKLHKMLNLTNSENLKKIGIDKEELVRDKELCRKISDLARKEDYEAILAPSAADKTGVCLAIYVDKMLPNSKIEVVQQDKISL